MSTMTYPQALHLLGLAKGLTLEKFEALNQSGILSDIFNCENLSRVDRYSLQRVLEGERLERVAPLLLTCEVGGKSRGELITELESNGMFVSDWAKDIMSKPTWTSGEKETVGFGRATVRELGFTHRPTWSEVLERIEGLGHAKCQPQDGPAIRFVLKDQPANDWFWCAMDLITGSDGGPSAFYVKRSDDGERWLSADWIGRAARLNLENSVAFRLRK